MIVFGHIFFVTSLQKVWLLWTKMLSVVHTLVRIHTWKDQNIDYR